MPSMWWVCLRGKGMAATTSTARSAYPDWAHPEIDHPGGKVHRCLVASRIDSADIRSAFAVTNARTSSG